MVLSTRASRSGAWILSAGWTSRKSSVCCNARSRLCAYIGGAEGSTPSDSPNPFELSSVSSPMLRGSGRCSLAQPFSSPATTTALYTMPMATSTFPHSTPQKRANKLCIDRSLLSEATATRQQDNLLDNWRLLSEHCSSGCCGIGLYRGEESAEKLLWHGRNSMARRMAGRDTRDWRDKREFEVFGTSNLGSRLSRMSRNSRFDRLTVPSQVEGRATACGAGGLFQHPARGMTSRSRLNYDSALIGTPRCYSAASRRNFADSSGATGLM